jgi:membrane protease YdiL (CAAX protease family)
MDDDTMAAPRPARRGIAYIFTGAEGLRAGWSLLLFVAIFSLISTAIYLFHPTSKSPPSPAPLESLRLMVGEAIVFLSLVVSAFIVSLVERRPFARYGLGKSQMLPDLFRGAAWGLLMLSLLVGALALSGALVFDGRAEHGSAALLYAVEWLIAFLLVGLFEEFLFRGFLQFTLARGVAGIVRAISPGNAHARTIGFWVAAAVFSVVLFALAHVDNGGESLLGIASVSLAGLVFVYVLYRTGSLWWAIGFHTTWDWAQSFLYGVADSGQISQGRLFATHPAGAALLSGGTTGPEGSVLVIPTLLLTAAVIYKTLPKRAAAFDA